MARQPLRLGNLWDTQAVLSEPPTPPWSSRWMARVHSGPSRARSPEVAGDHFVIVGQSAVNSGRYVLRSSHPLIPYQDGLDGLAIEVGETVPGTIDYPWDMDFYLLALDAGQTVEIVVDSAMIDAYLTVDFYGARQEEVVEDDDSGGGLFGLNARVLYTAPRRGDYFLVVEDAEYEVGGYLLTVTEVASGR